MPKISVIEEKLTKKEIEEVNKMLSNLFDFILKERLDELYLECEHGDEEHRKWLKDKFEDFYNRKKIEGNI